MNAAVLVNRWSTPRAAQTLLHHRPTFEPVGFSRHQEREHEARRQPGFAHGGASDAVPLGQGEQEEKSMSKEQPRADRGQIDIVYEVPPSAEGTYRYEREDGTTVHGDTSGEWTLDENGDADLVFFMSPRWQRSVLRDPSSPPPRSS